MKKFYTEKDIEDLFNGGAKSLRVDDEIALTDLAYEKAKQLGLQLIFDGADLPLGAPIRPYLSDGSLRAHPSASLTTSSKVDSVSPSVAQPAITRVPSRGEKGGDIAQRIRSAVLARLGNQIDSNLLDVIIQRVLKSTGVK